jgi:3D (Asp-Asp-Asp) domain-containing protein
MFTRLLASIFRTTPLAALRKVSQSVRAVFRAGCKSVAGFALSLMPVAACQSGVNPTPVAQPGLVSENDDDSIESIAANGPRSLGHFRMSFYYVIGEDEVRSKPKLVAMTVPVPLADEPKEPDPALAPDAVSDAGSVATAVELTAAVPTSNRVTLFAAHDCQPIAQVNRAFAAAAEMQGTGKLRDGRTVNVTGACECDHSPCLRVTGSLWGTGARKALAPFRTVAVDRKLVPLGQLLYIPALEGRTMPGRAPWGGFVHDGCVVAEDTGGAISGKRLDFFVARKSYYQALSGNGGSHGWARDLEVFDGTKACQNTDGHIARASLN